MDLRRAPADEIPGEIAFGQCVIEADLVAGAQIPQRFQNRAAVIGIADGAARLAGVIDEMAISGRFDMAAIAGAEGIGRLRLRHRAADDTHRLARTEGGVGIDAIAMRGAARPNVGLF